MLAPIAWVIGVPWQDATTVGSLIGQKIVINEFVAYLQLADIVNGKVAGVTLTDQGRLIATYALCGFANFSSIAIQIGGIGGLAPERRGDLARFGLRAVLGGSIATFMTATIAGVLTYLGILTRGHVGTCVVVGSFNVDHVWRCDTLPRPGETLAGRYRTGPGGKGFNQAVACARAGATTSFICALGDDLGGATRARLGRSRRHRPARPAQRAADRHRRHLRRRVTAATRIVIGAGANGDLRADFVEPQWAVIAKARVVLAQCESPLDAVQVALRLGRDVGAATLLNPAPANAEVGADLLALADILTPNETEFAALLARHCDATVDPDAVVSLDDAALHALCRRLLPHGTVVVTLGAAGVFVSHADDALRGDAVPAYRVLAYPAHADRHHRRRRCLQRRARRLAGATRGGLRRARALRRALRGAVDGTRRRRDGDAAPSGAQPAMKASISSASRTRASVRMR